MFTKDHTHHRLALDAWRGLAKLRSARARQKRYTYGDQWGDLIRDNNGRIVTEAEAISSSGREPLTNNLIRRLVKTVVGHYRSDPEVAASYRGIPPELLRRNALDEIDARMLEEFLISGCAIQRIVDEHRPSGSGLWVDNVSPDRFFANAFRDPRSTDIDLVGMLHDFSPREALARFAHGSRRRARALTQLFTAMADDPCSLSMMGDAAFIQATERHWRLIELWTLEADELTLRHDRRNAVLRRVRPDDKDGADSGWRLRFKWHCRWLAPDGTLIDEYDSPFVHGSHPFVVKFYPLTDGEVHSFVEDVIDQQHYINRVLVLIDKMLGASAKGVLLFPENQKMPQLSWQEIADSWSRADGIIPITGRGNLLPQQVNTPGIGSSAFELLSLELKLFDDISGVSSALMGRSDSSNSGSAMYQAQVHNSALALADTFRSFRSFTSARNALLYRTLAAASPAAGIPAGSPAPAA